jgi:hypothetical protein
MSRIAHHPTVAASRPRQWPGAHREALDQALCGAAIDAVAALAFNPFFSTRSTDRPHQRSAAAYNAPTHSRETIP